MGERFTNADSIHLTRLGWEAIGMIVHEAIVKAQLPEPQLSRCISALAEVDWSRTNRDWFGMTGVAEQAADGNPLLEDQGRERVVITGGKGDQGLRRAITYLRRKALPKMEKASFSHNENRVEVEVVQRRRSWEGTPRDRTQGLYRHELRRSDRLSG